MKLGSDGNQIGEVINEGVGVFSPGPRDRLLNRVENDENQKMI